MIISPTQIETFDPSTTWGCMRKWWFGWVKGIKGPPDSSQELGTALHSTVEAYLKGASEGVLHDLAIPGLNYLAQIRSRVAVIEATISPGELLFAGVPVTGRIDCVLANPIEITDWKTTSDIGRYAKTSGQLRSSTQMTTYAAWWFKIRPLQESLFLTHGYFQTKRARKFEIVSCEVGKKENSESVLKIEQVVERMKVEALKTKPDEIEPDERKCNIGFGCPHRAYCPRSGEFNMASLLDSFTSASVPSVDKPPATPAQSEPVAHVAVGVLPPDAGVSTTLATAPGLSPTPEILAADKPKRGRPPGAQNKSKVDSPLPVVSPKAEPPTAAQITKITIRHGSKIGMPNFSSATVEVEYEALVTGSVEAAREWVSMACKAAMIKELEVYTKGKS